MKEKLILINKIYPWYAGLTSDLIFFIAINSIWLTTVKGFSVAQITFFTTISSLFGILFQFPSLTIIKKMGNTKSIRFGSLLFLIASIMLTFCTKYISFIFANIFYEMAFVFTLMSSVLIKNNLEYLGLKDKYVEIRSKASLIYAVATAFITLFAGVLFNFNKYLPMFLGILTSFICLIMSFFLFDVDEKVKNEKKVVEERKFLLPKPFYLFFLILLFYAFMVGIVVIGQQNSKLLIQSELLKVLSVSKTATYLGIIMFISRLLRIVVNYFYPKIYNNVKNKMVIILACSLLVALMILLFGYYLPFNIYIRIIIMVFAFSFFPSLRDPINIYIQNLLLERFSKKYQKDSMIYLSLSKHIGQFLISAVASFVLLKLPLQYLFTVFGFIMLFVIVLTVRIKRLLNNKN